MEEDLHRIANASGGSVQTTVNNIVPEVRPSPGIFPCLISGSVLLQLTIIFETVLFGGGVRNVDISIFLSLSFCKLCHSIIIVI